MKIQLNRYTDHRGLETYGMAYDLSILGHNESLAETTDHVLKNAMPSEIWFYTVEDWTGDIWEGAPVEIVNREFSTCTSCDRDIFRIHKRDDWQHLDGDVTRSHSVSPKKPVVILDNDLEMLIMKYLNHLRAMGSSTYLEFHHNYNTPVEFTDVEWTKLQELDVDAIIKEVSDETGVEPRS